MLGDADDLYNILLKSDIINYYIHHFLQTINKSKCSNNLSDIVKE